MSGHFRRFRGHKHAHAIRQHADHGTKERWQHSGRVYQLTSITSPMVAKAVEESILDTLFERGLIDKSARAAGLKFKGDYIAAGMEQRVTGGYNPAGCKSPFNPYSPLSDRTDEEEKAYQRWRRAVRELGPMHSGVVIAVACHDLRPTPAQMPYLRDGLALLMKWYGIKKNR